MALDICGADGELSERDIEALRAAHRNGVHVVPCSARTLPELRDSQRQLGITGALIAERGAVVVDGSGAALLDERIAPHLAREIVARACELDVLVFMTVGGHMYIRPGPKRWWERTVPPDEGDEVVDDLGDHVGDGPTLIGAFGHVARLYESLPHGQVRARVVLPGTAAESLIVTPINGRYSRALEAVQRSVGVGRSSTLAIVSSEGAHGLFEAAAMRVARHDADERVILSATWHAPQPRDDVAAALEQFARSQDPSSGPRGVPLWT